jgi:hypothetical protein
MANDEGYDQYVFEELTTLKDKVSTYEKRLSTLTIQQQSLKFENSRLHNELESLKTEKETLLRKLLNTERDSSNLVNAAHTESTKIVEPRPLNSLLELKELREENRRLTAELDLFKANYFESRSSENDLDRPIRYTDEELGAFKERFCYVLNKIKGCYRINPPWGNKYILAVIVADHSPVFYAASIYYLFSVAQPSDLIKKPSFKVLFSSIRKSLLFSGYIEETGAFVSKSSVMRVVNRERLERSLTSKLIEQGRY